MRPTRRPIIVAGFSLLLTASIAGCNRTKAPYDVSADPYAPQQVYINDDDLAEKLAFDPSGASVSYDDADLMRISLGVRAATSRPQIIQYRTHFFDRTGQELYVNEWRTVTLESNTMQTLSAVATTPRAERYQIDIRTPR